MYYLLFKNGSLVHVTTQSPFTGTPNFAKIVDKNGNEVEYDSVIDKFSFIDEFSLKNSRASISMPNGFGEKNAAAAAEWMTNYTGKTYIPTVTRGITPRYDIVEAPAVGDEVSYTFNGDYYPDGVITKVSKKFQVTTSTGSKYYRRGQSACWIKTGGTWALVKGHVSDRNQEF